MLNSFTSTEALDSLFKCAMDYNKKHGYKEKDSIKKYHYTSLPVLFNILESDSLWVSSSRFSNDTSEEMLLGEKWRKDNNYDGDNYIFCLCDEGNRLSQWRGYCSNGGASIELAVNKSSVFSILEAMHESSRKGKHEVRVVRALPVVYTTDKAAKQVLKNMRNDLPDTCDTSNLVPLLKNDHFKEELESRIVFSNAKGELSHCIRFRTLENGVKMPYMVIKAGDLGKDLSRYDFDMSRYAIEEFISEKSGHAKEIWLPQGSNQEAIYNKVMSVVNERNEKRTDPRDLEIQVFCEGHLPIREIIAAPTYDRERVAEAIKRFCQSKYWLRSVKVSYSKIPYIPPSR